MNTSNAIQAYPPAGQLVWFKLLRPFVLPDPALLLASHHKLLDTKIAGYSSHPHLSTYRLHTYIALCGTAVEGNMASSQGDFETFPLGDWKLQSGEVIPDARIAFKALGDPALPAIVYPTWFSGRKSLS